MLVVVPREERSAELARLLDVGKALRKAGGIGPELGARDTCGFPPSGTTSLSTRGRCLRQATSHRSRERSNPRSARCARHRRLPGIQRRSPTTAARSFIRALAADRRREQCGRSDFSKRRRNRSLSLRNRASSVASGFDGLSRFGEAPPASCRRQLESRELYSSSRRISAARSSDVDAASYSARMRAFSSAVKERCFGRERASESGTMDNNLTRPHEFSRLTGLTHYRHRVPGKSNTKAKVSIRALYAFLIVTGPQRALIVM